MNVEIRAELREIAVSRILLGDKAISIAKKYGCHLSAIYQWRKRYRDEGMPGVARLKIQGAPTKLSSLQKKVVFDAITNGRPEHHNLHYELWTLPLVRKLIIDKFGITLSDVTVGRYLREFNLKPRNKPCTLFSDWQSNLDNWVNAELPDIKREAKKMGATIYFGNIENIRGNYHCKNDKSEGEIDSIVNTVRYHGQLKLLSAVSTQGRICFVTEKGTITSVKFINFLKRLINGETKPIYLIGDFAECSRFDKIQEFASSTFRVLKVINAPNHIHQDTPYII